MDKSHLCYLTCAALLLASHADAADPKPVQPNLEQLQQQVRVLNAELAVVAQQRDQATQALQNLQAQNLAIQQLATAAARTPQDHKTN